MKITAPQEAVDGFQRMLESFSERQSADETPSISIGQVKNEDFSPEGVHLIAHLLFPLIFSELCV